MSANLCRVAAKMKISLNIFIFVSFFRNFVIKFANFNFNANLFIHFTLVNNV